MFFTERKLQQRIHEINQYRFCEAEQATQMALCFDHEGHNGDLPPDDNAPWQPCNMGTEWHDKDIYVWVRIDHAFPAQWQGKPIIGLFDFGMGSQRRDFEALLFINQTPFHGLDQNHNFVELPAEFAGTTQRLYCRVWSGVLEGKIRQHFEAFSVGNAIQNISFAYRHKGCDELWYTSLAAIQAIGALSENAPERASMLHHLNYAYNLLDWSLPGSTAFYASIDAAAAYADENILNKTVPAPVTVHAVGHTHIDLAFLWQTKHTREKCARSFSTVLRLMERYPDYHFFQSQPQLYAWVKEDYPQIYTQIKQRIAQKRWEIDGAMWVEADCNLPSGESFVRQILLGRQFMQQEFGVTPRCLWLPDVFGYSWALPQILRKSGIDYFMTTKISWNEFNRMPNDTFHWKGIDGSKVLAHFITTPENGFTRYTYNGMVDAVSVTGLWNNYRDKELNQNLLMAYGYGDGGGGVNEEMLELLDRFAKMPGMPNIEKGGVIDYFTELEQTVANSDSYVHEWDGELYFESHRGTYTSQAQVKRANRKGELAIRRLDWLYTQLATAQHSLQAFPQSSLHEAWQILLRNQFHDIIPGSSIAQVYQDAAAEYAQLNEQLRQLEQQACDQLLDNSTDAITLFNSGAWSDAHALAFVDSATAGIEGGCWQDRAGNEVIAQPLSNGWLLSHELTPMSATTLTHSAAAYTNTLPDCAAVTDTSVSSEFYDICWNEHGQLTRLFDRRNQREVLSDLGNVFYVYEDKPMKYDAWDIEIFYVQKKRPIIEFVGARVTENGPLMCEVSFEWRYHNSIIKQKMRLYRHNPRIDFVTDIDWNEFNQLVKTTFPVSIRATEATYDIQFGNVKRPTTWNTSWEYARFESVAHQWADLSEFDYGVALLNDCKYGHAIRDNVMQLTLLKSAVSPDPKADRGHHHFTYSLLPHSGDWRQARVAQQAWQINEPISAQPGQLLQPFTPVVRFDHPYIQLDALKKAENEDALIVRLHEFSGGRQQCQLQTDSAISSWVECDLMEQEIVKPKTVQNESITISFLPYEIKTLKLFLS